MKAWEHTVRKTQAKAKKRANTLFGTSHSSDSNADAGSDTSGDFHHVERFLPNGEYYTGDWADDFPHGMGKYCWTDGCTYVGEWFRGKPMGHGTFTWPSSAMYQGNFKTGFMVGEGTYTGADGATYRGSWVMNAKHGYGTKEYANGDTYEGEWIRGSQDGQGKYRWSNGNYFIGEWKSGKISGNGTMFWANGNKYEGDWDDGLPKGDGAYEWADGSFYVGNWSKNPNEQDGTYYPSGDGNLEWEPQDVFSNLLKDCKISPAEKIPIFPSQKKLAGSDESQRQRRLSVDSRIEFGPDHKEFGNMRLSDGAMPSLWTSGGINEVEDLRIPKTVKRQGVPISKGHRNYDLMLNLQLGIRHSVARPGPPPSLDLKPSAFDPKEKFWTRFPTEGSKNTPPHQSSEFKWKDYCPKVFRSLRMQFKVDPADYMLSICGSDALRELSSPGKSGSFFYLTNDDRYMIKTMKKAETKTILRMLNAYYNHVVAFENTLVTKYFGMHCVKSNGMKVRFVIMGNLFCSGYTIHKRYDLKGSTFGRLTDKPESEIDANTTLKDLDLNFIFRLQKTWFHEFRRQVDRDCELLEQERIMDYSLLVGLHFTDLSHNHHTSSDKTVSRWSSIKLGINMPARVERTERRQDAEQLVGDPTGEFYDVVLFFGIIDILQDYDITKKLEHAYKSIQYDPNSISAVDPKQYSRRFRDYIFKAFAQDV